MSGVVSGITKVFSTVGSSVARVGKAVLGVGATTFTAGAATGAAPLAAGGLAGLVQKFTGTGVLGNILTGAITQAGYGALIGAATSALTGGNIGRGALMGAAGGAVSGGLFGAAGLNPDPLTKGFAKPPGSNPGVDTGIVTGSTATGAVPTGATAPAPPSDAAFNARVSGGFAQSINSPTIYSPEPGPAALAPAAAAAPAAQQSTGGGLGRFLTSEAGGGLIAGLGQGLAGYMASKEKKEAAEAERDFTREQQQRVQDSYNVGSGALHGPVAADVGRPTPGTRFGHRYRYDPEARRVVPVPA